MTEHVIFEIDNPTDTHQLAKFMRLVDTLRAMAILAGEVVTAIGCYKGQLNQSFIMTRRDFEDHIFNSGFVGKQESFLYVETGHKGRQYAKLVYQFHPVVEPIGQLVEVTAQEALQEMAWTYRPDLGKYWVAR